MPTVKKSSARTRAALLRLQTLLLAVEGRGGTDQLYPRRTRATTISVLPDEVLLEIFYFYVDQQLPWPEEDAWHTLVHVCQRWRRIVFASRRRLHLQLFCTNKRSTKNMLEIWPAFPIVITASGRRSQWPGIDNIIAALNQHNRVRRIYISDIPNSLLEAFAAMNKPFPKLTDLMLQSNDEYAPVLPDSFMGRSAPRLRYLSLERIPFPGLQRLLLSTTGLVNLELWKIPRSGYISPEGMAECLSVLPRLKSLSLRFQSPRSRADRENRHMPPLKCIVLPALNRFLFRGDSEYLEHLVSRINAPSLNRIYITFFNQLVFNTPQLRNFIGRTGSSKALDHADLCFDDDYVGVTLLRSNGTAIDPILDLRISCKPSDWQLSSLVQLYNSALSPLPILERLGIHHYRRHWQEDMENVQWLDCLGTFGSVKDLILSKNSFLLVAPALKELSRERVTEVLPTLQMLFLEAPQPSELVKEVVEKFIPMQQHPDGPVTVYHWEGRKYIRLQVGDR